ncbi:hypothetical protein CIK52_16505 [Kocuria rosea]|nr:hypothetical protein CIK52_16505 [Kocuria rosea]VEI51814.1 Uncharacterised protein [Kocuria rosea]
MAIRSPLDNHGKARFSFQFYSEFDSHLCRIRHATFKLVAEFIDPFAYFRSYTRKFGYYLHRVHVHVVATPGSHLIYSYEDAVAISQ